MVSPVGICHLMGKKVVFLSPSLSQIFLDFCLHETSSMIAHFLNSSLVAFLVAISLSLRTLRPSCSSQKDALIRATLLLISPPPRDFLIPYLEIHLSSFCFLGQAKKQYNKLCQQVRTQLLEAFFLQSHILKTKTMYPWLSLLTKLDNDLRLIL